MIDHNELVAALKEALAADTVDAPLLIKRIPFICEDIKQIKEDNAEQMNTTNDIANDLRWVKYIGGGFVAAAGLLALKSLGV